MHGYCEKCHKIRMVRVTAVTGKIPVGICAGCEDQRK